MNTLNILLNKAASMQNYRLPALVTMIMIHGNITCPLTLWTIHLTGDSSTQFLICTVLTMTIIVTNLAALPTKITIPVFAASTFFLLLMNLYNLGILFL